VLIELFLLGDAFDALERISTKIGDFAPTKSARFTISGRGGRPHNHYFSQKTRLNDLSQGIKMWTCFSSVLSRCTHLSDEQTEGRTGRRTDSFLKYDKYKLHAKNCKYEREVTSKYLEFQVRT